MVRELEDAPRDSVAIVLDVDAGSHAGPRGSSSLDEAVRAAAGLVRAHAARSRQALLVIGTPRARACTASGASGATGRRRSTRLPRVEAVDGSAARRAARRPGACSAALPELVVVSARPAVVAEALVARVSRGPRERARGRRHADLRRTAAVRSRPPTLLRLAGAGVPIAVAPAWRASRGGSRRLRVRAVG